jgi:hypothetical protein
MQRSRFSTTQEKLTGSLFATNKSGDLAVTEYRPTVERAATPALAPDAAAVDDVLTLLPGIAARVLDSAGRPTPCGAVGHLDIDAPALMVGDELGL